MTNDKQIVPCKNVKYKNYKNNEIFLLYDYSKFRHIYILLDVFCEVLPCAVA